MKTIFGFSAQPDDSGNTAADTRAQDAQATRSLVQIHFPGRSMTLSYFNDRFDLHKGDTVYVDGKLEGLRGRVVDVNYNFRIKMSDYQRVTGRADTDIRGRFQAAGSHFVTFDALALPYEKALTWFKAIEDGDEYVSGSDETSFMLDDLSKMNVSDQIAERGSEYYRENRVRYICVDGTRGRAIVEGTRSYEIGFEFVSGEIRNLVCGCFCCGACKHEVAAMLQLRETLELTEERFSAEYARSGYFAAVDRDSFFTFALSGREDVGLLLD